MEERVKNLPGDVLSAIPSDEKVLWNGRPNWKGLAYQSFGLKYLILYFIGGAFFALSKMDRVFSLDVFLIFFYPYFLSGVLAGLLFSAIAYFQAINTSYVITEKRVVIRSGAALIFLLNAPFKKISSIDKQQLRNHLVNISFTTISRKRIPYLSCWPSVKPWSILNPKPAFRCSRWGDEQEQIMLDAVANQIGKDIQNESDKIKEVSV